MSRERDDFVDGRPGGHRCLVYQTASERRKALVSFLAEGLRLEECCLVPAGDLGDLAGPLASAGVDVAAELERGALLPWAGRLFLPSKDGIDLLRRSLTKARASGFSGLRVTDEASGQGSEALAECEALLDHLTLEEPIRVLCCYSHSQCPSQTLTQALRAHPEVLLDGRICPSCFYEPPHVLLGRSAEEQADWMLARVGAACRGRAEEAAEASSRFQAVFEHALDAILLMDSTGHYRDANPAACNLLGCSREELLRMTVWDITPVQTRPRIPEIIERFLAEGTLSGEYTLVSKGAESRDVEFRSVANILPGLHLSIHRDVTERRQAEATSREYSERVQALSRCLLTIQEDERRHLARELHDEVGQVLTSLKFALEASAAAPQSPGTQLAEARAFLEDALTRIRELSFELRPALLDCLGLLPALRALMERYSTATGVRVNARCAGLDRRFAPEVETAAYRLVQEALTNVARHAQVTEVTVRVWVDEANLQVQVEDQGVGFDPEAVLSLGLSNGLPGMSERVRLLGGRLAIEASLGAGTHLMAELPLGGGEGGLGG